jgi:hypothetical protein
VTEEQMSDEPTEIDATNFDALFVDGAYLNFRDDYVRFLLYRDVSVPEKMDDGSVKFGNNRRDVLQEIRMPHEAVWDMKYELETGLRLYGTRRKPLTSENTPRLMDAVLRKEGRLMELILELGNYCWRMDKNGREEVAIILDEFIKTNKQKFEEIAAKHPLRKVETK